MQLAEQRGASQEQFEKAQSIHQEELEKCTSQLSKSLKKREMEYSQLESMHMAVKGELEQRVHELESKVTKSKEKVRQAEHRRAMDAEGFTNDVCLLRKQLTAVDRKLHQMRLQSRLEDDERLHGLLQKLERKGGTGCDQVSRYMASVLSQHHQEVVVTSTIGKVQQSEIPCREYGLGT